MAIRYESRRTALLDQCMAVFELLYRVAASREHACSRCGRSSQYLSNSQARAKAKKQDVPCRRIVWTALRRCPGRLRPVGGAS